MTAKIKPLWKRSKQHPNYYISDTGLVYSIKSKQFVLDSDNGNGYRRIYLYNKGKRVKWFIHRLVASVFIQNPNPSLYTEVHHLDHNKSNNAKLNLVWTTPKLNCLYRDQYYKGLKNVTN